MEKEPLVYDGRVYTDEDIQTYLGYANYISTHQNAVEPDPLIRLMVSKILEGNVCKTRADVEKILETINTYDQEQNEERSR